MRIVLPRRLAPAIVLLSSLLLSSCGGGSSTAGVGGSGVGGTGITTVTGNVSQVVVEAARDRSLKGRMLAAVTDFLSRPVNADSETLGNIDVFGGGRITTTDDSGNFDLEDVTPSQNFILNFTLPDDQTIALPIGEVPAGTRVRVINVVLDTGQGFASADDVEVEAGDGSSQDDDSVEEDDTSVEQDDESEEEEETEESGS